jgi:hypothetical protein
MSIFNIAVNTADNVNSAYSEIFPNNEAISSPSSPYAPGSNEAARSIGEYFLDIAQGTRSAKVQFTDGLTFATATVTWSGNVSNADTLTIGGQTITFTTGTPSGSQVKVGGSQAVTMASLVAFINAGGNALALAGYCTAAVTSTTVVTLYSTYPGPVGNYIALAKSAANLAVSAATFGSGGAAVAGAVAAGSHAALYISCGR